MNFKSTHFNASRSSDQKTEHFSVILCHLSEEGLWADGGQEFSRYLLFLLLFMRNK